MSSTSPEKLSDAESAADSVHERLRDAIINAQFRPNHRLVEEELAAALGVSRTPIREALLRLKQEGLVVRSRGWVVRDHTPEEIIQIIEAREEIESSAAGLAAKRITAEQIHELESLAEKMEASGVSRQEANTANQRFHTIVTDAAENFLLSQFVRRTVVNYWNFNIPVPFTNEDNEQNNMQHRELIAALKAGDSASSARIARDHVHHTLTIVSSALEGSSGVGYHPGL
jgi:DNA-binding GntR family transcriptional regulator